jgi:hypothetical protein
VLCTRTQARRGDQGRPGEGLGLASLGRGREIGEELGKDRRAKKQGRPPNDSEDKGDEVTLKDSEDKVDQINLKGKGGKTRGGTSREYVLGRLNRDAEDHGTNQHRGLDQVKSSKSVFQLCPRTQETTQGEAVGRGLRASGRG